MAQFDRHFTVQEAESLLPEVRALLAAAGKQVEQAREDLDAARPVLEAIPSNGGGKQAIPYLESTNAIQESLQKLHDMGVQVKDLQTGLVDFPAWREGREVLLCWRLGEGRIEFWHELDTGFAGRQPLTEEEEQTE